MWDNSDCHKPKQNDSIRICDKCRLGNSNSQDKGDGPCYFCSNGHSSLKLIQVGSCYIKQCRAKFKLNSDDYDLAITDLKIDNKHEKEHKNIYLCISLGNPFTPFHSNKYYCFKLIAAVIF